MKCELCRNAEATIHLTQVVDGSIKKVHLCESCAAESGVDVNSPMSITDILLGLGGASESAPPSVKTGERACPRCRLRRVDFKKTGRLGCPDCYHAFADELTPVIRAMHRNELHRGKVPEREQKRMQNTLQTAELKEQLDAAVAREAYEEAARIRDQLAVLRSASSDEEENS